MQLPMPGAGVASPPWGGELPECCPGPVPVCLLGVHQLLPRAGPWGLWVPTARSGPCLGARFSGVQTITGHSRPGNLTWCNVHGRTEGTAFRSQNRRTGHFCAPTAPVWPGAHGPQLEGGEEAPFRAKGPWLCLANVRAECQGWGGWAPCRRQPQAGTLPSPPWSVVGWPVRRSLSLCGRGPGSLRAGLAQGADRWLAGGGAAGTQWPAGATPSPGPLDPAALPCCLVTPHLTLVYAS